MRIVFLVNARTVLALERPPASGPSRRVPPRLAPRTNAGASVGITAMPRAHPVRARPSAARIDCRAATPPRIKRRPARQMHHRRPPPTATIDGHCVGAQRSAKWCHSNANATKLETVRIR